MMVSPSILFSQYLCGSYCKILGLCGIGATKNFTAPDLRAIAGSKFVY